MSRLTFQSRRCTRRDTLMAMGRATLIFGAVALAMAFIVQPGSFRSDPMLANNHIGLDSMATGSIGGPVAPVLNRTERSGGPAPCLEFPDGSRRGSC